MHSSLRRRTRRVLAGLVGAALSLAGAAAIVTTGPASATADARPWVVRHVTGWQVKNQTSTAFTVTGADRAYWNAVRYRGAFGDPAVVRAGNRWYAYATNTGSRKVPVLTSTTLTTWTPVQHVYAPSGRLEAGDALAYAPGWVIYPGAGKGLWAPSVARMGRGYTLAYSGQASWLSGQRHYCIGLARAERPDGRFRPTSSKPLECSPTAPQGAIDPELFVDGGGRNWLLWKFSGVWGHPATIYIRRLNAAGTGWAAGSRATALIKNSHMKNWEGPTIENPSMIRYGGIYYLFFSGGSYKTSSYATGYAVCRSVAGPCRKAGNPIMTTATTTHGGPGGADVFRKGQNLHLVYHAWSGIGASRIRVMHVATLRQRADRSIGLLHAG